MDREADKSPKSSVDDAKSEAEDGFDAAAKLHSPHSAHPAEGGTCFKQSRPSMVDEDVREAWLTRGWTLRSNIHRHEGDGLKELCLNEGDSDRSLEDQLEDAQKKISRVTEVNRQLRSAIISKKLGMEKQIHKVEALIACINSAREVEVETREETLNEVEELIRKEEKGKQDMQLRLSVAIDEAEERIASLQSENEDLTHTGANNKKLLKDQNLEIKEKQRAIRHLQRQIHVFEVSAKKEKHQRN